MDEGELKALLEEAISYKCPRDREHKSATFKVSTVQNVHGIAYQTNKKVKNTHIICINMGVDKILKHLPTDIGREGEKTVDQVVPFPSGQ
jgi:precorrin-6B methylase 2